MRRNSLLFDVGDRLLGLSLLAYMSLGLVHLAVIPVKVAKVFL